jgi:hypothetical protein
MKALVVNALRGGFDLEDIDIAAPIGREFLIDVTASGHTSEVMQFRVGDHLVATRDTAASTAGTGSKRFLNHGQSSRPSQEPDPRILDRAAAGSVSRHRNRRHRDHAH